MTSKSNNIMDIDSLSEIESPKEDDESKSSFINLFGNNKEDDVDDVSATSSENMPAPRMVKNANATSKRKPLSKKIKVVIYPKYWTEKTAKKYSQCLFVFGDNNKGIGKSGQAVIRDEPNSIGIPTKKYPNNDKTSFYSDDEYD
ncbi:unnamed protein product, partial [marine sediment metagenome]